MARRRISPFAVAYVGVAAMLLTLPDVTDQFLTSQVEIAFLIALATWFICVPAFGCYFLLQRVEVDL